MEITKEEMIYKKSWKYILIDDNHIYGRLKAVKDFSDVRKGDLGGYIQGYRNLSQKGDCWIYGNAWVFDDAQVSENAQIYGDDEFSELIKIQIFGNARIYGDAIVSGFAYISGRAQVCGNANIANQTLFKGVYL